MSLSRREILTGLLATTGVVAIGANRAPFIMSPEIVVGTNASLWLANWGESIVADSFDNLLRLEASA